MARRQCSIEGCDRPVKGRGFCSLHYQRWWSHGDPLAVQYIRLQWPANLLGRLRLNGSCVEFGGAMTTAGYGSCRGAGGRTVYAHRAMYELMVGPIPTGLTLDHLCRNTACVNPGHLEPVSMTENIRRALTERPIKTHCKWGHEFTPENTYVHHGSRSCRACVYRRNKEARARGRSV